MLKNYIKTALRNIQKHKVLSMVNILGLTIGISATVLIGLYIHHEMSYDKFHRESDRIYRIERLGNWKGNDYHLPQTNHLIAPTLTRSFPEIEDYVRIWKGSGKFEDYKQNLFDEEYYLADNSIFDVFSFSLLRGNEKTALSEPNSIVLTEKMALKYFNTTDALGKNLPAEIIDSSIVLKVTGVMKEFPVNSHLQSDILLSYQTAHGLVGESILNRWIANYLYSYVLLKEGADIEALKAKFPGFIDKHMSSAYRQMMGDDVKPSYHLNFHLQPLERIYLYARLDYSIGPAGDINKLYSAGAIALLVLIIACINYINLSTAKSLTRAKEVGLRKTFGAFKRRVVFQFLSESVVLSFIAVLLSMIIIESIMPLYQNFLGKDIQIGYRDNPLILLVLLIFSVLVGILAGLYPSLYIAKFKPTTILKRFEYSKSSGGSAFLRKVLVVFQFAISIALVVSVLTMNKQLNFMINKDLGFDKEQVVEVPVNKTIRRNMESVKDELLNNPSIKSVSAAESGFGGGQFGDRLFRKYGEDESENKVIFIREVDKDFIPTLGIEIIAGENFTRLHNAQENAGFILNEEAVRELGYNSSREAVGDQLLMEDMENNKKGKIVGVMKNFHYQSLQYEITPLIFTVDPLSYRAFYVKMDTQDHQETLEFVKKSLNDYSPNYSFDYAFVDETFEANYRKENRMKSLFMIFSILAIFIACMGLFGLATFMVEQKTKEVGIRKAMGSSTMGVITLLTSEFMKWVLISNAIAWPVAYIAMRSWLQNFAYQIDIYYGYFILASVISLLIAFVTVFYKAYSAATISPVKSLRYE
ncbi:MAG: ABC transporter permease [Bacteroidales bacterium]